MKPQKQFGAIDTLEDQTTGRVSFSLIITEIVITKGVPDFSGILLFVVQ